ncbi:hypothetical protein I7I50_10803 [Histoplasma capsulatum G186AR]|nr:hypothetical protein I7I50_10803 [Histoplasma capsulatum G186AR]
MRIHLPHKVGYFPAYAPPAPVLHFVMPLADFFFNVPCIWMPPAANRELKALHRLQADVRVHYKKPAEIPVKPKPMKGKKKKKKNPNRPKRLGFFSPLSPGVWLFQAACGVFKASIHVHTRFCFLFGKV